MAGGEVGCRTCGGRGWRLIETAEGSHAERCECWLAGEAERRLQRAGVPPGLRHLDLETFETAHHPQLEFARRKAQEFVDIYPLAKAAGLLFHGRAGTGKTHLCVAIVRELVLRKGARARFLDFRGLLKTIQESWNPDFGSSEKQVLEEILEADLLALDDLGAEKPSPWVRETVAYVINERYVRGLPVVLTTNLRVAAAAAERTEARQQMARRQGRDADLQVDRLEDRVGVATLSRLFEMCLHVPLDQAPDYRRTLKVFGTDRFRTDSHG